MSIRLNNKAFDLSSMCTFSLDVSALKSCFEELVDKQNEYDAKFDRLFYESKAKDKELSKLNKTLRDSKEINKFFASKLKETEAKVEGITAIFESELKKLKSSLSEIHPDKDIFLKDNLSEKIEELSKKSEKQIKSEHSHAPAEVKHSYESVKEESFKEKSNNVSAEKKEESSENPKEQEETEPKKKFSMSPRKEVAKPSLVKKPKSIKMALDSVEMDSIEADIMNKIYNQESNRQSLNNSRSPRTNQDLSNSRGDYFTSLAVRM